MSEPDQEVQRVSDALDDIDRIADPEQRVRARNRVLALQAKRTPDWHKERRQMVFSLRNSKTPPMSIRKIAARLEMSAGVVQDILRGHTGAWKDRPRAPKKTEGDAPE
ncbi:hypothetical protein ABZ568_00825 [Streptomyces olindensis]|uniref:Helix-turn-helix DNA binding domain protein n=1 Tax=Streptomyces olindensis TaxID=358823 RepID=A0ABV2XLX3_9ACTN